MRRLCICLLIFLTLFFAGPLERAAAEVERVPVTTERGLTLTLPADWLVLGLEGESFGLMDPEGIAQISVSLRDDIEKTWGIVPQTADDLMATLTESAYVKDAALGELRLENRATAVVLTQPYESAYVVGAVFAAQFYRGEYAAITLMIVDFNFERNEAFIAEILAILDSVTFAVPSILYRPPALLADMPDGHTVFVSGSSIRIPEGWTVAEPDQPVEFTLVLLSPDGRSSIMVEEPEDPARLVDDYRHSVAPLLAEMAGDETFDPVSSFSLMTLPGGRLLLTYDSRMSPSANSETPALWYQLVTTEFGVLQLTTHAPDADSLDTLFEPVLGIIQSYDVSDVEIEDADCNVTCSLPSA